MSKIMNKDFKVYILFLSIVTLLNGCSNKEIIENSAKSNKSQNYNGGYTWMTMRLPWEKSFNVPFLGKGYRKDSEEPEIKLTPNTSFTIYAALGSYEYLVYNVVAIRSDGSAIAAYKDPTSYNYYQKKIKLTDKQINALRKVLIKNNAGKMVASSIDTEKNNGVQGGFTIKSGRSIRRSYFSNSWPSSFQNIVDYINNKILEFDPLKENNGFVKVEKSIITVDPEATFAIRGLINGK